MDSKMLHYALHYAKWSDAGGLVFGSYFGKMDFSNSISPKKTPGKYKFQLLVYFCPTKTYIDTHLPKTTGVPTSTLLLPRLKPTSIDTETNNLFTWAVHVQLNTDRWTNTTQEIKKKSLVVHGTL